MELGDVYSAPKAHGQPAGKLDCRREGKLVYIPVGSDLPQRCVKCNAPARLPIKKKKMYWHHPGWYLLILANILIYAVAALIARKTMEISPGLCEQHYQARRNRIIGFATLMIISVLLAGFAGNLLEGWVFGVSVIMFFVSAVLVLFSAQIVSPAEIKDSGMRIKGCGEAFLASLDHRA